jgi:hypothetical protein
MLMSLNPVCDTNYYNDFLLSEDDQFSTGSDISN